MLRNNVNLVGRLTKDIDQKKSTNGKSVTSFSLAVNDRKNANNEQVTFFFNIVAWAQHAEYLNKYSHKGDMVGVQGRLTTRQYTNQRGEKVTLTEIVAEDVQILNNAQNNAQKSQNNATQANYNSFAQSQLANEQYVDATLDFDSDDLPF